MVRLSLAKSANSPERAGTPDSKPATAAARKSVRMAFLQRRLIMHGSMLLADQARCNQIPSEVLAPSRGLIRRCFRVDGERAYPLPHKAKHGYLADLRRQRLHRIAHCPRSGA